MVGLLLATLALGASPGAAPVGYAQATGYFKKDSRPTLFQPLNLLDAREITSWCSTTSDHLQDTLVFGFKGVARIDEIRIYTGNGFDETTFRDFGRARKILLKSAKSGARTLTLEDHRGLQAFSVDPPLDTAELALEVQDVYPSQDDPDVPVCLTDVVFFSNGKALNGAWLTQKLKYDRDRAGLLGTWFAGFDGAPDRFLSFYYDETYRLSFEPFEQGQKPRSITGSYDASGVHVLFEVPGKGRVNTRFKREQRKDATQLSFEGNVPEDWKHTFRDKR